jgi:hypothetical protein
MTKPEELRRIMKDAKTDVDSWPTWMRDQEPRPSRHNSACDSPEQRHEDPKQKDPGQ